MGRCFLADAGVHRRTVLRRAHGGRKFGAMTETVVKSNVPNEPSQRSLGPLQRPN